MKRFSRVLALVLLLSLVLTAFGIFTGYAAEDSSDVEYGETVYDMSTKSKLTVSNGANGPTTKKHDGGIWEVTYKDTDPSLVQINGGDFFVAEPSKTIYINGENKNTDYLVIDFDISTETSLLDGIYFHNRWLNASDGNAQGNYIQLNGTSLQDLYVSRHQNSGYTAPATKPGDWLNVTFVYDLHGTDTSKWTLHIYFDGIYCGSQAGLLTSAVKWYFMRISTDSGVKNGPDASTLFANFTYKIFENGYTGPISKGVLGNQAIMLDQLPDLAYTQENVPGAVGEKTPLASIARVGEEEPITAWDYDDINVNLKDGDVVTLYKTLSTPIVKDSGATVTWKDANGKELIPGTFDTEALVYVAAPTEVDYSAGTVLQRSNSNIRAKSGSYGGYTYTMLADLALTADKEYDYWLLDDTTVTAAGFKPAAGRYVVDLNGYTLTIDRSSSKFINYASSANALMNIRDGALVMTTGGNNYGQTISNSLAVFEDLDMTLAGAALFDQRAGVLVINRCNIDASCNVNILRSSGNNRGTMIVNDSDIVSSSSSTFWVSTINSSGARQGSMDNRAFINNSKITSTAEGGNVLVVDVYANATGTAGEDADGNPTFTPSSAAYGENDNDVRLFITNSELISSGAALKSDVKELRAGNIDATEQFSFDFDINLQDCEVYASYLYEAVDDASLLVVSEPEKYTYAADIDVYTSNLHLTNEAKAVVNKAIDMPSSRVDLYFGEECRAPGIMTEDFIEYAAANVARTDSVSGAAGAVWVNYPVEGLPTAIYTKNVKPYPYILNGHEYEFMVHADQTPGVDDIPVKLPADSSMLSYEWIYNVDGAFEAVPTYIGTIKANVTAGETLALNIYLPATFGENAYKYIYTEKQRVTDVYDVTVDGVAYKAFTIPGIDPATAAVDTTVKFRVVDENGTTANVTAEISVLDYIEAALKDAAIVGEDKALVASLLNYVAATAKYNDPLAELDPAIAALLALDEYKSVSLVAPALGEAKATVSGAGAFSALRVALNNKLTYEFLVKDGFEGEITFAYTYGGEQVTKTVNATAGEIISIGFLAYEFEDAIITVTTAQGSGEINLAGYLGMIPESEKTAELTALIDAIRIYTASAKAARW